MRKNTKRRYLPSTKMDKTYNRDWDNCYAEYKLKRKKHPELTYDAYLQIKKELKATKFASPTTVEPSLNQYKGHDSKQAWESLYSHVEDNGHLRNDNICFDAESRYKVPAWVYQSAIRWRPKGR